MVLPRGLPGPALPAMGGRGGLMSATVTDDMKRVIAACAVVLAEARAGHNVADGPVLCAQAVGRAAVVSRSG